MARPIGLADLALEDDPLGRREVETFLELLLGPEAGLDLHGEFHLLLGGEQRVAADLLEVHADGVGHVDELIVGDVGVLERRIRVLAQVDLAAVELGEYDLERLTRCASLLELLLDLTDHQEPALAPTIGQDITDPL